MKTTQKTKKKTSSITAGRPSSVILRILPEAEAARLVPNYRKWVTGAKQDHRKAPLFIEYQDNSTSTPVYGEISEVAALVGKKPETLRKLANRTSQAAAIDTVLKKRWPKNTPTVEQITKRCDSTSPIPSEFFLGLTPTETETLSSAIRNRLQRFSSIENSRKVLRTRLSNPNVLRESELPNTSGLVWLVDAKVPGLFVVATATNDGSFTQSCELSPFDASSRFEALRLGQLAAQESGDIATYLDEYHKIRERSLNGQNDELQLKIGHCLAKSSEQAGHKKLRSTSRNLRRLTSLSNIFGDLEITTRSGNQRDKMMATIRERLEQKLVREREIRKAPVFRTYCLQLYNAVLSVAAELPLPHIDLSWFAASFRAIYHDIERNLLSTEVLKRKKSHRALTLAEVIMLASEAANFEVAALNTFFTALAIGPRPEELIRLRPDILRADGTLDYSKSGGYSRKPYLLNPSRPDLTNPTPSPLVSYILKYENFSGALLYSLMGGSLSAARKQPDLKPIIERETDSLAGTQKALRKRKELEKLHCRNIRPTTATMLRFSQKSRLYQRINDVDIATLLTHATTKELEETYGREDPMEIRTENGHTKIKKKCEVIFDINRNIWVEFDTPIRITIDEQTFEHKRVNLLDRSMTAWDAFLVRIYCEQLKRISSGEQLKNSLRNLCTEILIYRYIINGTEEDTIADESFSME